MPEDAPSRPEVAPAEPAADPGALARRRGLRFVLLAHPAVQGLRFLSKFVLAWFLTSEDLGEAVFASLFALFASQIALFGLDEALVQAPRFDGAVWRAFRGWSARAGLVAAALVALAGLAARALPGGIPDHPELGVLLLALAPMVWIANRAVLPTALLVRTGDYKGVFLLDVAQVIALALGTWIPAALGAGPFSLVVGWYANALAAAFVAEQLARPHVPSDAAAPFAAEERAQARRFARALCLASLSSFAVERFDGLGVGAKLGRAALGAYELAQQLSTAALGYTTNLVERLVFPVLADAERAANLARAWREALRVVLVYLLPLHVLLALAGGALVLVAFPERWRPAGELVPWLALGAGARSLDLVASAALKAAGRGRAVTVLAALRLGLLAIAVVIALPQGLAAVACAVCVARALAAAASTGLALARVVPSAATTSSVGPEACTARSPASAAGPEGEAALDAPTAGTHAAFVLCAAWCALVSTGAWFARDALAPGGFVAVVAGAGLAVWLALRVAFDRAELARELAWLRTRAAEARA